MCIDDYFSKGNFLYDTKNEYTNLGDMKALNPIERLEQFWKLQPKPDNEVLPYAFGAYGKYYDWFLTSFMNSADVITSAKTVVSHYREKGFVEGKELYAFCKVVHTVGNYWPAFGNWKGGRYPNDTAVTKINRLLEYKNGEKTDIDTYIAKLPMKESNLKNDDIIEGFYVTFGTLPEIIDKLYLQDYFYIDEASEKQDVPSWKLKESIANMPNKNSSEEEWNNWLKALVEVIVRRGYRLQYKKEIPHDILKEILEKNMGIKTALSDKKFL